MILRYPIYVDKSSKSDDFKFLDNISTEFSSIDDFDIMEDLKGFMVENDAVDVENDAVDVENDAVDVENDMNDAVDAANDAVDVANDVKDMMDSSDGDLLSCDENVFASFGMGATKLDNTYKTVFPLSLFIRRVVNHPSIYFLGMKKTSNNKSERTLYKVDIGIDCSTFK